MGRPDINAKFHMMELVLHVPLAWWLITNYGVTGAAIAWTVRVTIDATLLFVAASRLLETPLWKLLTTRPVPVPVAQDAC
jgi:Na+-driven multidrug efflux pump